MRPNSRSHLTGRNAGKWDTSGVLLPESAAHEPMDLAGVFDNTLPVEVEIGSGKGTFLLARAGARGELNFLGVEWARAYCHYTADRIRRAGLTNVRMIRTDATTLFHTALPEASVQRVHVYFPDPWPKRRHHHRRLIQPAFVEQVRRVLRPGGQLIVVTDHLDYFFHIRRVLHECHGLARVPFPKMTGCEDELVGTNFERKYIAQGRPFYSTARLRYV